MADRRKIQLPDGALIWVPPLMRETAVEAFFDAWTEAVDREAVPSDEERRIDGDLLEQVVLNACPGWMSDEAAKELAERVLARCADTGYFVVLRGPDSEPWTPDQPVAQRAVDACCEHLQ